MISTTTTVTSGTNPSNLGDSVSLTGTVSGSTSGPNISGTITFFRAGVKIGSGSVVGIGGGGTTGIGVSGLLAGGNSITAVYSGDSAYSASVSSPMTQTVNKRGPSIVVSAPSANAVYGQPIKFTASGDQTGPATLPAPTGIVTFYKGVTSLGTAPFVPSGGKLSSAVLTVSNLAVGASQSITASYAGDSNYNSTTSNTWTQNVNKASTATTIESSVNPSALCQSVTFKATVKAASPGVGLPTGTVTFTIDGTAGSAIALSGGVATYTTSALTQASHTVSAAYNGDSNFNTSSSGTLTQTVNAAVNWVLTASAAVPDPEQAKVVAVGPASVDLIAGGLLAVGAAINAAQSTKCDCGCKCKDDDVEAGTTPLDLTFSARTLNVKPIITVTLASDHCSAVPSQIQVQLTWNGVTQAIVTFATTGHAAGDVYNLPLQVSSAVSASGIYSWSVEAWATVGTTVYHRSFSGTLPVVENSTSPFGIGRTIRGTWSLLIGTAGVAMADGTGATRYFTGTPGSLPYTFTSPANEKGTLVKNANGSYTYTAKDQVKKNFDSTGHLTSQVDARGLSQSFAYASGKLSTITQPDGGVASLSYTGNLLSSVAMPGGRSLSFTYSGSDLTGIVDAAGGLRTLAYDGSHRLTNDQFGALNTTYAYDANGALQSIDRGLGALTTITAAAVQGLGAGTAINASAAVAVVTDALGHVTTSTLDALGRTTKLQTADGAEWNWMLNAAGSPTVVIDPLQRVTTNTYDASENLTQVEYPDGTLATFAYDATFNKVTRIEDALNHVTTLAYDPTTGDLLTVKDALGNATTYTWSSGLKQTMTDALGRVTSYTWDTATRRELTIKDALGNVTTMGYDAAGNKTSEQDALGRLTTMTYDGERRLLTRKNALNGLATYVYDAIGNLTSSLDELGRATSYAYDQRGLRTSTTEAVGTGQQRTTTNTYDAASNLLYVTDPLGDITSYGYDAVNRPIKTIQAYGSGAARTATTVYDAVGNVQSTIDPRGTTTSFGYDAMNRPTQRIEAYGNALQRTTTTAYDAVGNVQMETNPGGTSTSFGYDEVNRQTLRIDAYGSSLARSTTTVYDAVGNTQSVTNAFGAVTSFAYDALNRKTQLIEAYGDAAARTTTTVYDAVSNIRSVTNPRGIVASYVYDALNRRINAYDDYGGGLQRAHTMVYDAASNLLSASNGLGVVTSFAYDALNRRINEYDAYGTGLARTLTMVYDADNNVTVGIDALGNRTTYGYDALNRRITVTDPGNGLATTVYDANDNAVNQINQLGNKTTYVYDALNRKTQTIDPLSGIVTLAYDINNNLQSLTDPVSNKTQWIYDALDHKIQEIDPLSYSATFAYDAIDRQTSTTDKLAQVVTYGYDALNRQINATNYAGTGLLTYTFDANNNLLTAQSPAGTITQTYDALDRLSTLKDVYSTLLTLTYDAADNKTLVQDSFGGATSRVYDALNRLTTMTYSGQSATLREDITYTARDQQAFLTRYSNLAATVTVGTTSMSYDAVGRLTNLQHKDGSAANIANYTHTYDAASRIATEKLNGGATTTYQYDTTDQLTRDAVVSYTYDANGNRTMAGYATGANNQITSDGTWNYFADKNGNIVQKSTASEIWTYGYDNRNRLNSVTDVTGSGLQMQATYVYDTLAQRVEKSVLSGGITTVTRFAYDETRQIIADLNGSNVLQLRYVLGMRVLERKARITSGGIVSWLLRDYLGSIRNVTDATGAVTNTIVFDGFGNIVSQTNPGNGGFYLWASYRIDPETGLLRADLSWRYYDPVTGRWYTVDPISFLGGDTNLGRYVINSPTNLIDPTGQGFPLTSVDAYAREAIRTGDATALRWLLEMGVGIGLGAGLIMDIRRRLAEVEPVAPVRPAAPPVVANPAMPYQDVNNPYGRVYYPAPAPVRVPSVVSQSPVVRETPPIWWRSYFLILRANDALRKSQDAAWRRMQPNGCPYRDLSETILGQARPSAIPLQMSTGVPSASAPIELAIGVLAAIAKVCKPCIPPVGTISYRLDKVPPSKPHHPFKGDHAHLYEMHQSPPPVCICFWSKIDVVEPPLPPNAIPITPAAGGGI